MRVCYCVDGTTEKLFLSVCSLQVSFLFANHPKDHLYHTMIYAGCSFVLYTRRIGTIRFICCVSHTGNGCHLYGNAVLNIHILKCHVHLTALHQKHSHRFISTRTDTHTQTRGQRNTGHPSKTTVMAVWKMAKENRK